MGTFASEVGADVLQCAQHAAAASVAPAVVANFEDASDMWTVLNPSPNNNPI